MAEMFQIGDVVRRVSGTSGNHTVGTVGTVAGYGGHVPGKDFRHIRFEGEFLGYNPERYKLVTPGTPPPEAVSVDVFRLLSELEKGNT